MQGLQERGVIDTKHTRLNQRTEVVLNGYDDATRQQCRHMAAYRAPADNDVYFRAFKQVGFLCKFKLVGEPARVDV